MFTAQDFKNYRSAFGFSNQGDMRSFLSAKDIVPSVNYDYVDDLNVRLTHIVRNISHMSSFYNAQQMDIFLQDNLDKVYQIILREKLLPRMNNQGRRPEQVYFSWMRGHLICQFFKPYIAQLLDISMSDIEDIGDDDYTNIQTFKRTAKADLQVMKENHLYHLEIQSGFQGINDVKQHKVLEANRLFMDKQQQTLLIHFDIFNGQVALILLHCIKDGHINWITRQQMEGQTVFNLDQNYFQFMLHKPVTPIMDINNFFNA